MRLPLRHRPPAWAPPLERCRHLEVLAEQLVGVPLGPAAELLTSERSRGRYGNALQWHLGLPPHDGLPTLDWEDRIEVKLVSVWRRPNGRVGCDKLKVCDIAASPWRKLSNVLWVFVDRLTRIVVEAAFFHLDGGVLQRLARSWECDPHFEDPMLFVEARETDGKRAPAYYLSAQWFEQERLLPSPTASILPFDPRWWRETRLQHGREPQLTLTPGVTEVPCPRCGGPMRVTELEHGWAPAWHGMPLGPACAVRGHALVDARRLVMSPVQSQDEFCSGLEGRLEPDRVWRLADRVPEPEDHQHIVAVPRGIKMPR